MSNIPKFGLAIDWETSGYSYPDYAKSHQGISFGAIIFETKTLNVVEELYCEIVFDEKYKWDMGAQKVHGITKEHLNEYGITQEHAASLLCNLVIKYIGTEDVMLMGHRVYFDKAFTIQLTQSIGIDFAYHPTTIDTCSMATVLMEMSKSEDVFQTLGLPGRKEHNALEDIRYTLESVKRMKELFLLGVATELSI